MILIFPRQPNKCRGLFVDLIVHPEDLLITVNGRQTGKNVILTVVTWRGCIRHRIEVD